MKALNLEVWSDIACPWCYIGKRRLEAALAEFEHRDAVNVTWRSFELDPSAPAQREVDATTHLAQKYGTTHEEALAMQQRMADVAAGEGLDFTFDLSRGGNTFDAHRLLHLAAKHNLQDALKERLMRAYLTEGQAIGDPAVLAPLAHDAGLPIDEANELLETDRFATEVRDDERTAAALGIQVVPFFVVDRTYGAAGAQPAQVLLGLLREVWAAPAAVLEHHGDRH